VESARDIGELCRRLARDPVTVRVSRGKGVRFGPLLDVPELARGPYGLVGHLHSKPAANVNDQALGRSWRHFLWQHLVGDFHPMLDWIGSHAADCPGAGLLFPEEPQLTSRPVPDALTRRLMETLKLAGPLPRFTDFPRGGMFWVRPKVLAPFYRLGLGPEDFFGATEAKDPASDALQRLLPDVTRRLRLEIGTIHIPGLRRSPTGG
jgi:lipopolysaccharide biosynthesis protein